ncbi:alpha/beta hydrolase [Candidatus Babeliales bacterium]|nr:alpha/beta hydrolase [Candidatus Babeliales bacterium]
MLINRKCFMIVFSFLSLVFSSYPVVILVHGTFSNKKWCSPGGGFYEVLSAEAALQGDIVVPFAWSGKLSHKFRMRAAKSLVKLIQSYPRGEKIILIGHSHGGNIINLASHLLYDPVEATMESCWHGGGIEGVIDFVNTLINTYPNSDSSVDTSKAVSLKENYYIDKAYLIATPVLDKSTYVPCMKSIHTVLNLYSEGDGVQTVLGFYKRKYNSRDNLINVQIKIEGKGLWGNGDPKHRDMHDPLVAKKLLSMSDLFSAVAGDDIVATLKKDGSLVVAERVVKSKELVREAVILSS